MKVHLIVAARPNFVKAAPLCRALARKEGVSLSLVHTGQHYDPLMSDRFFADFDLPDPVHHLGVAGGSHAEQIAGVLAAYGEVITADRPDWTVVVGDVNATLASTLAAKHSGVRVGHVEAGLRSNDLTMPEEINRKLVDAVADRLWAPSQDAMDNLTGEGRAASDMALVGNVMVDAMEMLRPQIDASDVHDRLATEPGGYCLASLHRPHNVDTADALAASLSALDETAEVAPVLFPVHPRTKARMGEFNLAPRNASVRLLDPLDYVSFMRLQRDALLVITDSGGVQEETTQEGVPCLTLRPNTERPITLELGTNQLVTADQIGIAAREAASAERKSVSIPYWDGGAAERIVKDLLAQG